MNIVRSSLVVLIAMALMSMSAINPPYSRAAQQETSPEIRQAMSALHRALARRGQASTDNEIAAGLGESQAAAKAIIDALDEYLLEGRQERVEELISGIKGSGVRVERTGSVLLVRFPRAVWYGLRKKLPRSDGIHVQSDFCYEGWSLIDHSTILVGGSGCSYSLDTYYCPTTGAIMNCTTTSCGGGEGQEDCREPVLVLTSTALPGSGVSIGTDLLGTTAPRGRLIKDLYEAVRVRASGALTQEAARAQITTASRNIVETLSANVAEQNKRYTKLVRAAADSNITVIEQGRNVIVRFPRQVWGGFSRQAAGGISAQGNDFCLTGWELVDDYWVGSASCSTHFSTYYCSDSGAIINCIELCRAEEACGEPIILAS